MYENINDIEKMILIAVQSDKPSQINVDSRDDTDSDMQFITLTELAELAKTAGAEVVGELIQRREAAHPKHYFGKGKIDELKDLISLTGATGVICDDELSSAQIKHMNEMLDVTVMDRTVVILDIFAQRASSAEGKVQVELAQLRYRQTHLTGFGKAMSRIGGSSGAIGTKGPGETKLETDRRGIRERIGELEHELREIETQRSIQRGKRLRTGVPSFALIGYTNAGKSTLMNTVSNAGVLAENKLFATLDTNTRKILLPSGMNALLTDTVGFIKKLPHTLIKAFRATLEELKYADVLLHVVDASNPDREQQMEVVYQTLKDLDCYDKPVITVFNKTDLPLTLPLPADLKALDRVGISAQDKTGIDSLLTAMEKVINRSYSKITVLLPFSEGELLSSLKRKCNVLDEEYREDGVLVTALVNEEYMNKVSKWV